MKIDINYNRVVPRDLFNEAKLLKCMGKLCLAILDNNAPINMTFVDHGMPFMIGLIDEGSLTIKNLSIFIDHQLYLFKTTYNSKSNYPLFVQYDYCDYKVFNEDGDWDEEFLNFIKTI